MFRVLRVNAVSVMPKMSSEKSEKSIAFKELELFKAKQAIDSIDFNISLQIEKQNLQIEMQKLQVEMQSLLRAKFAATQKFDLISKEMSLKSFSEEAHAKPLGEEIPDCDGATKPSQISELNEIDSELMNERLENLNEMSDSDFETVRNSVLENEFTLNEFHAQNGCEYISKSMVNELESSTDNSKLKIASFLDFINELYRKDTCDKIVHKTLIKFKFFEGNKSFIYHSFNSNIYNYLNFFVFRYS
jgi:hypothetical protein